MATYVEFKGLKHYPLGDAKLELVEGKLKVSNFGKSGLDGYYVELPPSIKSINTVVDPYLFNDATIQLFTAKALLDGAEQITGQLSFGKTEKELFMNAEAFGIREDFTAQAYLDGKIVEQWKPDATTARVFPWLLVAYIVTHATFYYETTTTGNKVRHEVGGNWNGARVAATTGGGKRITTDRVTVRNDFEAKVQSGNKIEFTAANLSELVIADYRII